MTNRLELCLSGLVLFGAVAVGVAVGLILGVIFFVILDDNDKSKRLGHLYKFLGVFTGLGGGSGVAFGFIDIKVLPLYIGVAAIVFVAMVIGSLALKKGEWL